MTSTRAPRVERGRKPQGFPSTVTIAGHKIKVVYCNKMPKNYEHCDGISWFAPKAIYISLNQPKDEMEHTLVHEIIHYILHLTGNSFQLSEDLEESIVRALEHNILKLYKRKRGNL